MMLSVPEGRGHTLIEFVIAVSLGLAVTAGVVSLYSTQRTAFDNANNALRMRDAGLTALTVIGQQLQMAGFVPAGAAQYRAPAPLFGCSGGHPAGTDDSRLTCETLTGKSDGVAVRYVGDSVSTWPSSTGQTTDCLGQAVTGTSAPLGDRGVPVVNRFYAKPSSSTGEPELYCEGNGKTGSPQPLVEGVERLRIRYWLAGASSAVDASAVTAEQWPMVAAVDLCVLVRGAPQGQHPRYTDCDGAPGVATDSRPRQAFWRRVALRNYAEGVS